MSNEKKPGRLVALDYLRGYFILVIIIDHLYRWPSALAIFTGQGSLWFNAADGFVIVSGLMIGYVRGYKGMKLPLASVTEKLWKRAALLYLWLVIATVAYTGFAWLVPTAAHLPYVPITTGDWGTLLIQAITMKFSYVWINFLYLYTIFLAIAPAAIWLLRRRLAWLLALIVIGAYFIGESENIKWLQWQPLFFLPAIAGFYLESIRAWWLARARRRTIATYTIYSSTITLLTLALLTKFILPPGDVVTALNTYFSKDHIEFGALFVPLIVFCGFVLLFIKLEPFIERRLDWILMPFGTHSLTVYIIHGVFILLITYLVPSGQPLIINTLVGIFAILGTLLLLKVPWVRRFIPR
jgi:hypothetical protein